MNTFAWHCRPVSSVEFEGAAWALPEDGFAYLPPGLGWRLATPQSGTALLFEKPYVPCADEPPPLPLRGALQDVPATPFLGDEAALLQTLLPETPRFDWGINVFEFAPGGTLPLVETHFMEHGLYMLAGQGVYRLGEHWYPVQAGDAIWMAPYLTQWYAATGKLPTRYIYYKEMHRAPSRLSRPRWRWTRRRCKGRSMLWRSSPPPRRRVSRAFSSPKLTWPDGAM